MCTLMCRPGSVTFPSHRRQRYFGSPRAQRALRPPWVADAVLRRDAYDGATAPSLVKLTATPDRDRLSRSDHSLAPVPPVAAREPPGSFAASEAQRPGHHQPATTVARTHPRAYNLQGRWPEHRHYHQHVAVHE